MPFAGDIKDWQLAASSVISRAVDPNCAVKYARLHAPGKRAWCPEHVKQVHILDMVKFVLCTLVSGDCMPFCKYIKRHLYPGNQGTHDKLNQIQI